MRRNAVSISQHCDEVSNFAEDVNVGSGITIPVHLTPQVVLLWRSSVTSYLGHPKRDGRKSSLRDPSNVTKRGKIPGIMFWRKL